MSRVKQDIRRDTPKAKDELAEVAAELFAEHGVASVTIDDIVQAAGYSRTTAYTHFGSKQQILDQIVLVAMQDVLDIVSRVAAMPMPADAQLHHLYHELVAYSQNRPFFFKSLFEKIEVVASGTHPKDATEDGGPYTSTRKGAVDLSDTTLAAVYDTGEQLNAAFAGIIEAGIGQGLFRPDLEPFSTGMLLFSELYGIAMALGNKGQYLEHKSLNLPEVYELGFELMLAGIGKR